MLTQAVHRRSFARLRMAMAWLVCLAQLCLPLAHAAQMASPTAQAAWWCGNQDDARAIWADLPPELRAGLDAPTGTDGKHLLSACAQYCAQGSREGAPPPQTGLTVPLTFETLRLAPHVKGRVAATERYALAPPAQGPPSALS
ncbi:hypothetical protein [Hylemonella gracilis]|uniref:Uncharacterized protein n=1 Tax=Hylemonella gracilis ATCC 19624 TaxID=887062 RepID=F3KUZ0_9BURK|nr:hypothetical protein [Hylemonella gracilis]EGI76414.1 hypothetical protein HGR_11356 [Hylemonella gracilis ATCC 19624]